MATSKTCVFFEEGTNAQFEFVLTKYDEALKAKAHAKSSKPESLIKLDKWYQNELPKKIKSRGKEPFLTHDEIVQTIKWKLARGQFRPRLKDLVQMNTPRVVMQETKKAFRQISKKNDLESAVQALSNLKGVGPAMASAVLAAGVPEIAPFMADECLLSLPEIEGIDYTLKEYLRLVEKTNECVERLNSQGGEWTPHKVELAIWTHYVARDIKPELLDDMPGASATATRSPAKTTVKSPTKETAAAETNGISNGVHGEEKDKETESEEEKQEESGSNSEEVSDNSNDATPTAETTTSSTPAENTTTTTAAPAETVPAAATETAEVKTNGDSHEKKEETETSPEVAATESEKEQPVEPTEEKVVNGEATNGDHSDKNGVVDTEKQTSETKQNGNANSPTKEGTCNGDSVKRKSMETEDSDISEAKRLKEDSAIPHPIQAN